ncbi:MAG: TolC family protein [bacterium]|nr:TolC family protein [bacterium]
MIRRLVCLLIFPCVLACGWLLPALAGEKIPEGSTVRFGVLFDDATGLLAGSFNSMELQITELLAGEYVPVFARRISMGENATFAAAKVKLDELMADPAVDLILTVGYISSTAALHHGHLSKPTIAPFALDAQMQGMKPTLTGSSGIRNLSYLSAPEIISTHIDVLYRILPFNKLAVMGPPTMLDLNPDWRADMRQYHVDSELEITFIPLMPDIAASVAAIPMDIEAVSVLTSSLNYTQIEELAEGLKGRRLPSFSFVGLPDVERGILACLRTNRESDRFSRRVAMNVRRILFGAEPSELPVSFSLDSRLIINKATARAIGIDLPWELRLEALLIEEAPSADTPTIGLSEVLHETLQANLDLKTRLEVIAAGRQSVKLARAGKLPQLRIGAQGLIIDEDRAASSMGQSAERTVTASASVSQLLYDDQVWANHAIAGYLQDQREQQYEQFRLDLILGTAEAYLNLLRAQTLEDIQRDNLQLSQSNLQQARFREKIGAAGPAEVYRWETKIAQDRNHLIQANSRRNLAEIELNRILNRPLEGELVIEPVDLDLKDIGFEESWIYLSFTEPGRFRKTREWVANCAVGNSPELQALAAGIAAQERVLSSANRAHYLPTFALQGSFDHILDRSGAGSEGMSIDPATIPSEQIAAAQFFSTAFGDSPDDNNWSVSLSLSLPLFEGGSQRARQLKARRELARLQAQHAALSKYIAQSAYAATHTAGASHANLRHSRDAADAAARTMAVVQDAYAQGAADLLSLLDAQNAALVTDQMAASAVYDFLNDYLRIERTLGRFELLIDEEEQTRERHLVEDFLAGD